MKSIVTNDLLSALSAVIKEGTFESAAKYLKITQSAVSQRIKQLEENTGAILILRERPCRPTEIGSQLCQHFEKVNLLEHDLMLSLQNDAQDHTKDFVSLRIAVNADSLVTWFSPVITHAVKDANILLDILVDDQENTAERLRTGEALAAVTVGQKALNGFKITPLGVLDYVTVASPEFYDKYFSSGLYPTAVSNAPCLTYNRKDLLPQIWVSRVFGMQLSLNPIWVPSYSGYLDCCCNGAGWGLMPRKTVQPHISEGILVELKPETDIDVPLFWQYSVNAGKTMNALTEIITAQAGGWLTLTD